MVIRNKKGQLKIQQMAFMLIAVTIFFALVGMIFASVIFSNLKKASTSLNEKNALLLVSRLSDSPEFSCGNAFGGAKINCVDFDKVMALKDNINAYSGFWGVKEVEIRKLYPFENSTCSSENYPNCGKLILFNESSQGVGVSNFVSLCHKESVGGVPEDKCELAQLIVYY